MNKEQWDDMTEGMKEEPSVVTDYLETMYDELSDEDICGFYEVVLERKADGTREELFAKLLEELYVLTEEQSKKFAAVMKQVQKRLL